MRLSWKGFSPLWKKCPLSACPSTHGQLSPHAPVCAWLHIG
eukprot:CAMPEP_0206273192 /NCGR_PEP_ID=MMETSP0047_2-20121206/34459_1 /ASSEMBLY_ACC=CAM_ASM_000192 /TAXON_ID=195065 /ORGANISM="Chroomonas mesostigmatica_cf, Strain CCMP1168" /LENGTH=40 /DNA_ID= /DNA_START= /DNA_END= /DNA_ORIENTATION=